VRECVRECMLSGCACAVGDNVCDYESKYNYKSKCECASSYKCVQMKGGVNESITLFCWSNYERECESGSRKCAML